MGGKGNSKQYLEPVATIIGNCMNKFVLTILFCLLI